MGNTAQYSVYAVWRCKLSHHSMFPYSKIPFVGNYMKNIYLELLSNLFPKAFQRTAKAGGLEVSTISKVFFFPLRLLQLQFSSGWLASVFPSASSY